MHIWKCWTTSSKESIIMDTISIVIVLAVVAGVAYFLFGSKSDDKQAGSGTTADVKETVDVKPATKVKKPAAAKKATAKKATAKKAKLPSDTQLQKNTKGQLEELGRKHGVELDKRKTKAKMIGDLKAGVKAK